MTDQDKNIKRFTERFGPIVSLTPKTYKANEAEFYHYVNKNGLNFWEYFEDFPWDCFYEVFMDYYTIDDENSVYTGRWAIYLVFETEPRINFQRRMVLVNIVKGQIDMDDDTESEALFVKAETWAKLLIEEAKKKDVQLTLDVAWY